MKDPADAPAASSADSGPVPVRRDPRELRVPPRPKGDVSPVVWVRLRAVGDTLAPVDEGNGADALTLPAGIAGDVERLLGEARPAEALATLALALAELDAATTATLRTRAYLMDGRVDDARAALGERDRPEVALGDAALALAEADLDRAERRVLQARESQPRDVGCAYVQALVRVARGDLAQGAELLTAVARAVPSHAVARFQLGQILFAQGDPARAGTLYEMAWELQPTFIGPPMALADMFVESRQYGEALAILERVCALSPTSLPPRQLQLRILVEIGEREAALQLGRMLHEQVPDDGDTTLLYADALIDGDRAAVAVPLLEGLLARGVEPAQATRARRLLARAALAERRVDDALQILRTAAEQASPQLCGEVALELAQIAVAQRRPAEIDLGLVLLQRSVDLGSLVSGALLARQHGLHARARALAEAARALVPGTPAAAQLDGFIASL